MITKTKRLKGIGLINQRNRKLPNASLPLSPTGEQNCMSSLRATSHYEKCRYSTHEMHEKASALKPLLDPTAKQILLQHLPEHSCYVSKKLQGQPRANLANMAPAKNSKYSKYSKYNFVDNRGKPIVESTQQKNLQELQKLNVKLNAQDVLL